MIVLTFTIFILIFRQSVCIEEDYNLSSSEESTENRDLGVYRNDKPLGHHMPEIFHSRNRHDSRGLRNWIVRHERLKINARRQDKNTYVKSLDAFYHVHYDPKTWLSALIECKKEGAELLLPSSQLEFDEVRSLIDTESYYWINYQNILTDGKFSAVPRRANENAYENWKEGKPNSIVGNDKCVVMAENQKYQDNNCDNTHSYICKKYASKTNENEDTFQYQDENVKSKQSLPRQDYNYVGKLNAFYKSHFNRKSWINALAECRKEGAELLLPSSKMELDTMKYFISKSEFWLSYQNILSNGTFFAVDGRSNENIYENWANGEPNNRDGNERCATMYKDTSYSDNDCNKDMNFICKKTVDFAQLTEISVPESNISISDRLKELGFPDMKIDTDSGYTYIDNLNAFYKEHLNMETWSDALAMCREEEAELLMPTSESELDGIKILMTHEPYWLGYQSIFSLRKLISVDGRCENIYVNWKDGEPNNKNGGERCVEMDKSKKYKDTNCNMHSNFICKKVALNSRGIFGFDEIQTL